MPKKAGTEKWKKKRRQEYMELKEYRYYIFCEGQQTEPRYFEGFKKMIEENPVYRDMVLIEIEPFPADTSCGRFGFALNPPESLHLRYSRSSALWKNSLLWYPDS